MHLHVLRIDRLWSMSADNSNSVEEAICPFCGLLCDDINVTKSASKYSIDAHGCRISESRYRGALNSEILQPQLHGNPVDYEIAIQEAATLISASNSPVVAGMMTDVAGSRAALELADRTGAVIDHHHNAAYHRNNSRLQTYGGYLTTLSEARNRADLIVLFGSELLVQFPRLLEKLNAFHSPVYSAAQKRTLAVVGKHRAEIEELPENSTFIECDSQQAGLIANAVRSNIENRNRPALDLEFVSSDTIDSLTKLIMDADYPVLAWCASNYDNPLGDLVVDSLVRLIDSINKRKRCAGLMLTQSPSTVTVNQVATWQCGNPTALSFASGSPEHHPEFHSLHSVVKRGNCDLILWLGGLEDEVSLPETAVPKIVIARSDSGNSDLFIPVGIPGVHHDAHLFRTDVAVSLYLRALQGDSLPSTAEVISSILQKLENK